MQWLLCWPSICLGLRLRSRPDMDYRRWMERRALLLAALGVTLATLAGTFDASSIRFLVGGYLAAAALIIAVPPFKKSFEDIHESFMKHPSGCPHHR